MAFFQYRAADQAGKVVEGVIEADAEQSVVSRLREMGCVPLRIAMPSERAVGAARQARPLFEKRRVSQQQLLQFTRELATLLNAGLPLDRSLSILGNLFEGAEFSKTLRSLVEAVLAGKSLAAAMGEHPLQTPLQPVAPPVQETPRLTEIAAPILPAPYLLSLTPATPVRAQAVRKTPMLPVQKTKPSDGKRIWTVQVAAVSEKNAAESLAEKLRRLGHDAYVNLTNGKTRTWHRVRVGQLASHKDAAQLRDLLSAMKEHPNAYITAY